MNQQDELATPDEIEFWRAKAEEVGGVLGAHFHDALDRLVRASWSSRPHVVEAEVKTCDHCGRTMGDFAGGFGRMTRDGIHYNLCHPNDPRRADCYHLVTTRAEAVGARRNTP